MKPIKLEIDGLNSFETKQTLDFSNLSNGVFGIFGKTGSGKSTILDAITLALYGEVGRSKQNISFINTKCQRAIVILEFEIFVAGKNKRFEASRTFSKKKNGQGVESSAELYELVGDGKTMLCEGVNKVDAKIFDIIGLGANEFAKCIALPQGEFSAFLKAKPAERTEIMSNIFDLSKYGEKLALKVKEKYNEFDKKVLALESSIELVKFATDEELVSSQENLSKTSNDYQIKSKELKEKSQLFGELKNSYENQVKLEEVTKTLSALSEQKQDIETLETELEKNILASDISSVFTSLKKDKEDEKELTDKISLLNESRLKRQAETEEAKIELDNFKEIYEAKIIELNSKIAKLSEIQKHEENLKNLEEQKTKIFKDIEKVEDEIRAKQGDINYLLSNLSTIDEKIEEIDSFIDTNKADVELSYALEQTKGIESELLIIDEIYKKIEALIDQTNEDLASVQEEYNSAISEEKQLRAEYDKIQSSIEVAFEDVDTTDFAKLRSVDKQLEGMNEVDFEVKKLDELASKLDLDNENRWATIASLDEQIKIGQEDLADYEKDIQAKEQNLVVIREEREGMLGENVISLMSEHLKIGDFCPVCSNRVIQKIYTEQVDLSSIDSEVDRASSEIRAMRFERDKKLANLIALKTRVEFEKAQIELNQNQIKKLMESRNVFYQRFVDNNDESEANFNALKALFEKTADTLEDLITIQNSIREAEQRVIINKTQAGTKITVYKNYLESLIDVLYRLQNQKAEREFVILNVEEKYKNLKEYKKQIAEGKNIEIIIDSKKEEKLKLRERQNSITTERIQEEKELSVIKTNYEVLNEKLAQTEKQILISKANILQSGVPENTSVQTETEEAKKALAKLKFDNEQKQVSYDSCKQNLDRTEQEYSVTSSILQSKKTEIDLLQSEVNEKMISAGFSSNEELEKYIVSSDDLKEKQNKITDFNSKLKLAEIQKVELEKLIIAKVDEEKINELKSETEILDEEVKRLSGEVGRLTAEYERIVDANKKLKEFSSELSIFKHNLDLAKELTQVLKGKALAEYVAEEYLDEITKSANNKLSMLMDGRYTLKFENKEFFVEDNFNEAKTRPASTLSGGETFLVSLSLALSISDAISSLSSRSMDFFFLDEGFGTLDAELCEAVVNALYKLESHNLSIGLISHVGELEESIKNKVIVTKDSSGSKLKIIHSL